MQWMELSSAAQFESLLGTEKVFAVFKHSTRCSISSTARNRVERDWNYEMPVYIVDVIRHRDLSNRIAELSGIRHESPQLIVFREGKPVYNASHSFIYVQEIEPEFIQS